MENLPPTQKSLESVVDDLFAASDLAIHALYTQMIDHLHEVEKGPEESEPNSYFSEK